MSEESLRPAIDGSLILIIEDNQLTYRQMQMELEKYGCTTINTHSANSAIGLLTKNSNYDLIIADIMLSDDSSGFDVIDYLIKRRIKAKVIVCSAHLLDFEALNRMAKYGLAGQVSKPFGDGNLIDTVEAAITNGRYLCDEHNDAAAHERSRSAKSFAQALIFDLTEIIPSAAAQDLPQDYSRYLLDSLLRYEKEGRFISWDTLLHHLELMKQYAMLDQHQSIEVSLRKDKHLVVLVHGINTRAQWMNGVGSALEDCGYQVASTSYGRWAIWRFLAPCAFLRKKPTTRVLRDIRSAINIHKPERLSVISHSFGTYVMGDIILNNPDLYWDRIIFCGSILRDDYPVDHIASRFKPPLINEIGSKDYWPIIGESAGWGYGSIGSYGLNRPGCKSRWHAGKTHSDFLNPEFCRKYWIPFLQDGTIVRGQVATAAPWWIHLIAFLPLRWVLIFFFIAFSAYFLTFVWPAEWRLPRV